MECSKNQLVSFFIFFSLLGIVGCSIEKRVHTGGYYIKWHKHYKGSKNEAKAEKYVDTSSTVFSEDTVSVPDDVVEFEPQVDSVSSVSDKQERTKLDPLPKKERKFEPLGVLAFKILLAVVPVGIIGDHKHVPATVARYEYLTVLIMLVSLILGIVSMVRYLRNPRHYRFNIFGIIAIVIPVIFFLMLLTGTISVGWKYLLPKYW